ncbi:MAG: adenosylcobinamide-GDP ribazoletransferase [Spirochaetia bacterium]|nr:adenosylcobinamide-GDP ribazoletransferase [Spirochaetia bacterium]
MSSHAHGFLSTWSLISRIPVPLKKEPDFAAAGFWMPIVGLGASAAACLGAWLGLLAFGPGLLAALVSIAAQYSTFNLFHLDGLLDTADAAGVSGDLAKRREVLKDPRLGSYALLYGFLFLASRLAATSALLTHGATAAWAALALAPVSGRFSSVLLTAFTEPYGHGGLAALLGRPAPIKATIGYAIASAPAVLLFGIAFGPIGAIASVLVGGTSAIITAAVVGHWYGKHLGGYSGDALGATVELGELLILVISVAIVSR